MSDFPYTDEQVSLFQQAGGLVGDDNQFESRDLLSDLLAWGITVNFPEPRYYVTTYPAGASSRVWNTTRDHDDDGGWTAEFHGRDHRLYAQEHADRLNATDTP